MNGLFHDALSAHGAVLGPLDGIVILTNIRTFIENPALLRVDRDGCDHLNAARANSAHPNFAAGTNIAQKPGGQMRRHMYFTTIGQQKAISPCLLTKNWSTVPVTSGK